jgi:hypothetical protein
VLSVWNRDTARGEGAREPGGGMGSCRCWGKAGKCDGRSAAINHLQVWTVGCVVRAGDGFASDLLRMHANALCKTLPKTCKQREGPRLLPWWLESGSREESLDTASLSRFGSRVHGEFVNHAAMGVWYNPRQ